MTIVYDNMGDGREFARNIYCSDVPLEGQARVSMIANPVKVQRSTYGRIHTCYC
jgi:hypothetical protein